jgi:hypothetical protein
MSKLNLHELTDRLLQSFLPVAVRHRNLLVNDVPADIYIDTDRELAASVVSGLLSAIVGHVENGCIRLSAKIFDTMILFSVTDKSGYNNCGIIEGLQNVQPMADKIGAVLKIADNQENAAVIAFSFSNTAA